MNNLLIFGQVSVLEFETIVFMYNRPREIQEISEYLGYTDKKDNGARVIISGLKKKGYVEVNQSDVKNKSYSLTPLGHSIVRNIKERLDTQE